MSNDTYKTDAHSSGIRAEGTRAPPPEAAFGGAGFFLERKKFHFAGLSVRRNLHDATEAALDEECVDAATLESDVGQEAAVFVAAFFVVGKIHGPVFDELDVKFAGLGAEAGLGFCSDLRCVDQEVSNRLSGFEPNRVAIDHRLDDTLRRAARGIEFCSSTSRDEKSRKHGETKAPNRSVHHGHAPLGDPGVPRSPFPNEAEAEHQLAAVSLLTASSMVGFRLEAFPVLEETYET